MKKRRKRNIKSWLWIKKLLIPPYPLRNIEIIIRMNHQNESRFSGVYSRYNLSKSIKDGHT